MPPSRFVDSAPAASPLWGLMVTVLLGLLAWGLAALLARVVPGVPLDAVVLAILAGIVARAVWTPGAAARSGIDFAARPVLEVAIVLLGVATDLRWMVRAGGTLALAICGVTVVALGAGLWWGRLFGLAPSHALLVASGNAICGNSAIAAVASITGAPREETASSIAYTAILSLALVLALPLVRELLGMSDVSYGIVTGLTVYAVPQVLAAAFPVSAQAGQVGTLVKLVRILMLIPLVLLLALRRVGVQPNPGEGSARVPWRRLVPWYVIGFLMAAIIRSAGLIPDGVAALAQQGSHALTILAMAALGLGVEVAMLRRVGWRTAATATVSLLTLCLLATVVVLLLPAERTPPAVVGRSPDSATGAPISAVGVRHTLFRRYGRDST